MARAAATPEQRNGLARLVFQAVEIHDDRVVAVVPQPDFAPFFVDRAWAEAVRDDNTPGESGSVNREIEEAEATGGSHPHLLNPRDRPVRVPVPDVRPAALSPPRSTTRAGPDDPGPRRYRESPCKLTPAQESAIRALAYTKSLRSVAADFGVSHETVRSSWRWSE